MLPPVTTCPNEPVEVDEPVTFPLVVMVPNVGPKYGCSVEWKKLSFHHHHLLQKFD